MQNISSIRIKNFKIFKDFSIDFNPHMNILIGPNECGKSTILEAIGVVINQSIKNIDLFMLEELMNDDSVKSFKENPTADNLPRILIQAFFSESNTPSFEGYTGKTYEDVKEKDPPVSGIEFLAEFPKILYPQLDKEIESGIIPYEYYNLTWTTFAGQQYHAIGCPIKCGLIDTSNSSGNSFYSYTRYLYNAFVSASESVDLQFDFSKRISEAAKATLKTNQKASNVFILDQSKSSFPKMLTVKDESKQLPLSSRGKGTESLIKIRMMIEACKQDAVICIEEPENHLSFILLRKVIDEINKGSPDTQMIITSHSSDVLCHLGLRNAILLSSTESSICSTTLKSLSEETKKYFEQSAYGGLLKFVLSKKVILVEGPSEEVLIPKMFFKMFSSSMESKDIECLSINGLSFARFLEIAFLLNKNIAIITDNDKDNLRANKLREIVKEKAFKETIEIFSDLDSNRWTFEVCVFEDNKEYIKKILAGHPLKNDEEYQDYLLNNKADCACLLSEDSSFTEDFKIPKYIEDALHFIYE